MNGTLNMAFPIALPPNVVEVTFEDAYGMWHTMERHPEWCSLPSHKELWRVRTGAESTAYMSVQAALIEINRRLEP